MPATTEAVPADPYVQRLPAAVPQDLRALGKLVVDSIETYLASLSQEGLPSPEFTPESKTIIPSDPAGQEAQRTLLSTAERIVGLVSGPAGLYGLSRQFFENAALQVACDLDLANAVPHQKTATAKKLGAMTGAEPVVIVRIMRALTPLFIFEEVEPECYRHTARSWSLRDPQIKALMDFGGNDCFKAAACLPENLKEHGYKNIEEPSDVAFCKAYNSEKPYFAHVFGQEPSMGKRFTEAMAGTVKLSYEVGNIAEIFPFNELVDNSGVGVVVDVGGGKGQVMQSVARRYPNVGLELIVQDLQENIEAGKKDCCNDDSRVLKWMAHDFFEEQPVKAASAYFLRHILHDWPDKYCVKILKPIVAAMDPCKSRLLIADMVVPSRNAPKAVAHRDLLMMAHVAGRERTKEDFAQLFRNVDDRLSIHQIWQLPGSGPGGFRIIEARLAEFHEPVNGTE